jgi:TRAP transporter TAXI family solute receptor
MYIYIILVLILIFHSYKIKDHFVNYKKITVTPSKMVYSKLYINTDNYNTLVTLAKFVKNIYPIYKINLTNGSKSNIKLTNKHLNNISFIQEHIHDSKKYPNVRFISGICINYATLIVSTKSNISSWKDLEGKVVGTLAYNSGSYHMLNNIKNLYHLDFEINIITFQHTNIVKNFNNNTIDAYFIICPHPDETIQNINKYYPLKFIGINGLNNDIMKIKYPYLTYSKIDITNYKIFHYTPTTLRIRTVIICNKDFSHQGGYRFIETIFKNLLNIKTIDSDTIKLQMKEFNPDDIYLANTSFKLHKGVHEFYKNIGLITNNKNKDCVYAIGSKECNLNKLNRYRLL